MLPVITLFQFLSLELRMGPVEILASMPDPMRPYLFQILFVMALVTVMYIYLRFVFFKPLTQMMSKRASEIHQGSNTKQMAAQQVAAEEKKYQEQMKSLRTKAFERKKELSSLAVQEKKQLIDQAQREVALLRAQAQKKLEDASIQARKSLEKDIQDIAEAMVQQILPKGNR